MIRNRGGFSLIELDTGHKYYRAFNHGGRINQRRSGKRQGAFGF